MIGIRNKVKAVREDLTDWISAPQVQKSVPKERAASSRMELFKGDWGRCPQQAAGEDFPLQRTCVY